VIGHRGAAGHAPENTLAGIREAARLGAKWVEFDVHLSADGAPMLMHDDTLDRTTDDTGPVDHRNMADLRTLDAGCWYHDRFTGEAIPKLEATIALLAELGLGANVEIKPSPGREAATGHAVGRVLRDAWPRTLPPPLVSSFAEQSLAASREAAPQIARGLLICSLGENWATSMRALGCATLHCGHRHLNRERAAQVRRAGYPLIAYTPNDRRRAQTLFDWGVVSVITDYPDRLCGL
jgi:glycerophosphoryl diester phosphodiesterase